LIHPIKSAKSDATSKPEQFRGADAAGYFAIIAVLVGTFGLGYCLAAPEQKK